MRVHHLNCGSMQPVATPEGLVCHVLLLETKSGLVLVDSGYGLVDIADPRGRIGPTRRYVRPRFDPEETAIRQVERLGFAPRDVRHVLLTHFDADHVGGLSDFPWAEVHLTAAEAFGVLHPQLLVERERYRPAQRAHGPRLVEHTPAEGEAWRGFGGAKALDAIDPGIVLISLPGHTRGHAAFAIDTGSTWILHVGDAFYHRAQLGEVGKVPLALTAMERAVAFDWAKVKANHQRLAALWAEAAPDLVLVNAHDPALLRRAQER
ncbi:MBL fold metallo-hydrolase [Chondromyces crocatus]|uniref:MBL fold metallo-hydrolase n=1 Tax=Chondromyces crocatus TaxID=52 RepID=A0A0K1ENM7_CHOCO|nr:MBL fold metallo-hydrolase [Chondromyces crocatus]AKT42535.1 MBL fold metallo-hydrolase [Chondromyces crocatus]